MPEPSYAKIDNAAANGQTQIVAASTGKKITVVGYTIISSGTVNVKFQSHNTDLTGAMPMVANGNITAHGGLPLFETASGAELNLNTSAGIQISGHLTYLLINVP